MEVNKLKQLLGIQGEEKDSILQFALDDVEETILNYCHINQIPKRLENTAYRMAIDFVRSEGLGEETTPLSVSSITEGSTSTSFTNTTESMKDTILKEYEKQLRKYRKLVWE